MKSFAVLFLGLLSSASIMAATDQGSASGGSADAEVESLTAHSSKTVTSIVTLVLNGKEQKVEELKKVSLTKVLSSGSKVKEFDELEALATSFCVKSSGYKAEGFKNLELGSEEFSPFGIAAKIKVSGTDRDGKPVTDTQTIPFPCEK